MLSTSARPGAAHREDSTVAGTTKVEMTAGDAIVALEAGELAEIARAAREGGGAPAAHQEQADDDDFEAAAAADRNKPKTRASRTAPLTDATKAKIRKLARTGTMSRNAVARECGVSPTTVARVCAAAKPPITFDRTATAQATEAKLVDLKVRRAALSQRAVDEVDRLFGLLTTPHEITHWDKDGFIHRAQIELPSSGDVKNYATAIGILLDKHLALVKHDSDDRDKPAVDKWLEAMGIPLASA